MPYAPTMKVSGIKIKEITSLSLLFFIKYFPQTSLSGCLFPWHFASLSYYIFVFADGWQPQQRMLFDIYRILLLFRPTYE